MTIQTLVGGTLATVETVLANTTVTVLADNDESPILIHSITYACGASGDTLTLDTYDGSTARRLRQVAISANADGAFNEPFILERSHDLRGTLMTGNSTSIRVTYTIQNS